MPELAVTRSTSKPPSPTLAVEAAQDADGCLLGAVLVFRDDALRVREVGEATIDRRAPMPTLP